MAKIVQNVPKLFENFKPLIVEFHTTEELLNIPFVKTFSINGFGVNDIHFKRYCKSNNDLIVEGVIDNFYWVIGTIDDMSGVDLPIMEKRK